MKRALVPGVLVLLLALSGCVSVETSESRIDVTPGASGTYSAGDTTVVVEPLTAETSEAGSDSPRTPDAAFLAQVRDALPDDTTIPNATDAQLLDAAREACDQMAAGTDPSAVAVIEGEPVNGLEIHEDSAAIAILAKKTICP